MTAHLENTREQRARALAGAHRHRQPEQADTRLIFTAFFMTGSTRQGFHHRPRERPRRAAATSGAVCPPPTVRVACSAPALQTRPTQQRHSQGDAQQHLPLPPLAPGSRTLPAANAGGRALAGRAWEEEGESGLWEGGGPGRKEGAGDAAAPPRPAAGPPSKWGSAQGAAAESG